METTWIPFECSSNKRNNCLCVQCSCRCARDQAPIAGKPPPAVRSGCASWQRAPPCSAAQLGSKTVARRVSRGLVWLASWRDSSPSVAQCRSCQRPVGGGAVCRADNARHSLQRTQERPCAHSGTISDCRGRTQSSLHSASSRAAKGR